MELVMEVRKYTPGQSQAVSSLRVARITNIWQSPLLVAALMPPSTAYMCALVCRERGTKYFLVGRRSNTEVVKEPRNLVELRIASLAAATRRRHLMTSEKPLCKFVHGHECTVAPGHCTGAQKVRQTIFKQAEAKCATRFEFLNSNLE